MKTWIGKLKMFALGLALGALVAFPLGMNFGKEAPLLSNPLMQEDLQEHVATKMQQGAATVLEGARVKIHEATGPPLADAN